MLKWRPPTDLLGAASSAHSSCMASPSLDSVSESEETDVGYFGRAYRASPESTGYVSEDESVAAESDTTLEEVAELFAGFGHPLERMPRSEVHIDDLNLDSPVERFGHGTVYHPGEACSSWCPSPARSVSSVTSFVADYHAVIDNLLNLPKNPFDDLDPQNFVTFDPNPIAPLSPLPSRSSSLMIKRTSRESTELPIIFDLNSADLRQDPWNPCPHILQAVDYDPASRYLYLCMERLNEFNAPPMTTVAQYIDFFRQILEGLSFLHEHKLAGFSCSDPNAFMVDLSSGLRSNNGSFASLLSSAMMSQCRARDSSSPQKNTRSRDRPLHHPQHRHQHQHQHRHLVQPVDVAAFDRSIYPVRYYFVNFTHTRRIQREDPARDRTLSVPLPSSSKRTCPFKQDVKELGTLIERMLVDMPSVVCTKFRALIKAMTIGGFGAEDSRKLFEALTQSLDAGVFELAVRRGSGLRSRSFVTSATGAMSGSTYAPSAIRGDFGLEPDTVALSS